MAINVEQRYRQQTSGLHQRSIAGITVVDREPWDLPLVLNESLQLVWTCLEIGGSVDEIAADVVDVFGIDLSRAHADVEDAFRQLHERDLIEPVAPD